VQALGQTSTDFVISGIEGVSYRSTSPSVLHRPDCPIDFQSYGYACSTDMQSPGTPGGGWLDVTCCRGCRGSMVSFANIAIVRESLSLERRYRWKVAVARDSLLVEKLLLDTWSRW
jgi:hypothetical protein